MPNYYFCRVADLWVTDAEDFSQEPGDNAEWRLFLQIGDNYSRSIADDYVRDLDSIAIAADLFVVVDQPHTDHDLFRLSGYEADDSSKDDPIPWTEFYLSDEAGLGRRTRVAHAGPFRYELTYEVLDLSSAPWTLAATGGVQSGLQVHSGRAHGVVELPDSSLLVATEWGGIWRLPADKGDGTCLTEDFAPHHILCMASDHRSSPSVLAAGKSVMFWSESNPKPRFVQVPLPSGVVTINGVCLLPRNRLAVIASYEGLYVASYPDIPGGNWRSLVPGKFFDVRSFIDGQTDERLLATRWRPTTSDSVLMQGSVSGNLVMTDVPIPASLSLITQGIVKGTTEPADYATIDVCKSQVNHWFIAIVNKNDGSLVAVGRTSNGGGSWSRLPEVFTDPNADGWTISKLAGDANAGGGYRKIAVHPDNPSIVVLPWKHFIVSSNAQSGNPTWAMLGETWTTTKETPSGYLAIHPDIHADAHAVEFCDNGRWALATDGGITVASGTTPVPDTFDSTINLRLSTLLLSGRRFEGRGWYSGSIDAFPLGEEKQDHAGIGIGLQDNGSAIVSLAPSEPLKAIEAVEGDGGTMLLSEAGAFAHVDLGDSGPVQFSEWRDGQHPWMKEFANIPVIGPLGSVGDAIRKDPRDQSFLILERTRTPLTWNGRACHALAAPPLPPSQVPANRLHVDNPVTMDIDESLDWIGPFYIFGLFEDDASYRWEVIGEMPGIDARISALGNDATDVMFGCENGDLYRLAQGSSTPILQRSRVAIKDPILWIAEGGGTWFAASARAVVRCALGSTIFTGFAVPPAGSSEFRGMDVSANPKRRLIACSTDTGVFFSPTASLNWIDATENLPHNASLQDVRFAWFDRGDANLAEFLVLGTWGRSIWMTWIDALLR